MAFGFRNKSFGDTYNAKYSRLIGQIYMESDACKSVMDAVPSDVKREGFNDKTARELRKQIQDGGGLFDSNLEGKLTYFAITKAADKKGIEREYVKVGIRTEVPNAKGELKPATVFLSVPLKSDEGLGIVHKLVNAEFGENTKLSMFAQMKEGKDGRMYGKHTVGLQQHGETVKPVFPITNEEREAMRAKLKAEGKDNEEVNKELLKANYNATLPQLEVIAQRFESYREERKSYGEYDSHEEAEGAADRQSSKEDALPNEAAAQDRQQVAGDDMSFDDDMI